VPGIAQDLIRPHRVRSGWNAVRERAYN
jgi:hypothetical protein